MTSKRFLQAREVYIRCVIASLHVSYCFFPIRVVLKLSSLKGILLARTMEGNTNRVVSLNDTNYHLCIFLFLLLKSQNLCLMKNETLSVISEIHARNLWEKIESLYASKCGNNKLFLLNSIVSLKFKEDTFLLDHLNEFQGIIDQMSRIGIKFENEILDLLLLNSLLEFWETFKVSITNLVLNGVVSLQMVKCSVLIGDEKEDTRQKGKSKEKDDNDDDHVTIATCDDNIILRDFESVNLVSSENMWIIDSGATLHVTPRKEFFTSYTSMLKMGNDGVTKVISVGDVCWQTNTKCNCGLEESNML
ncbi:hypothetical protein CR513_59428, partial [Mucuna pruriens]